MGEAIFPSSSVVIMVMTANWERGMLSIAFGFVE